MGSQVTAYSEEQAEHWLAEGLQLAGLVADVLVVGMRFDGIWQVRAVTLAASRRNASRIWRGS
jgi:hypothetical protein